MFEVMLKTMGFDPVDFKTKFTAALLKVDSFDQRLTAIQQDLYTIKAMMGDARTPAQIQDFRDVR